MTARREPVSAVVHGSLIPWWAVQRFHFCYFVQPQATVPAATMRGGVLTWKTVSRFQLFSIAHSVFHQINIVFSIVVTESKGHTACRRRYAGGNGQLSPASIIVLQNSSCSACGRDSQSVKSYHQWSVEVWCLRYPSIFKSSTNKMYTKYWSVRYLETRR